MVFFLFCSREYQWIHAPIHRIISRGLSIFEIIHVVKRNLIKSMNVDHENFDQKIIVQRFTYLLREFYIFAFCFFSFFFCKRINHSTFPYEKRSTNFRVWYNPSEGSFVNIFTLLECHHEKIQFNKREKERKREKKIEN